MSYTLVNTAQAAQQAHAVLSSSKHIFFDCEGDNLGCVGGTLRLISVGTVLARRVFLFDVAVLSRDAVQPLLGLLANATVLKIVWDGRLDCVELRRTYGVELRGVLDLQLADIASRAITGVSDQTKKYQRWHPLHDVRFLDTEGVHCLSSLKNVLSAHGVQPSGPKTPNAKISHDRWLEHPLPKEYLGYAAGDIYELERVFTVFQCRSYVGTRNRPRPELEEQSARYVNMHAGRPIRQGNIYQSSNLFPLEILTLPPPGGARAHCDKCGRLLGMASFTYRSGRAGAPTVHASCKVCFILDARAAAKGGPPSRPYSNTPVQRASKDVAPAPLPPSPTSDDRSRAYAGFLQLASQPRQEAQTQSSATPTMTLTQFLALVSHEIAMQRAAMAQDLSSSDGSSGGYQESWYDDSDSDRGHRDTVLDGRESYNFVGDWSD